MNAQRIFAIVRKEWMQAFRCWSARIAVFLVPFVVTLLALRFLNFLHSTMKPQQLPVILDYYLVLFTAMPLIGTAQVAVLGMMEDKTSRSLEPLLVTPLTSGELLAGKILASALPATVVAWATYAIFSSSVMHNGFDHSLVFGSFKGMVWRSSIFLGAPLLAVLMAAIAFLISSRAKDARDALNRCNEIASLITLLVFAAIGVAAYRHFGVGGGLISGIVAGLFLLTLLVCLLCVKSFERENVLFKWK